VESQGLGLELTQTAKYYVVEKGYDPTMGALPLRRALQRLVEDPLFERILWKEYRAGQTIIVDIEPDPETGDMSSCSGPSRDCSRRRSRRPAQVAGNNPTLQERSVSVWAVPQIQAGLLDQSTPVLLELHGRLASSSPDIGRVLERHVGTGPRRLGELPPAH
jgi:hypothetical protein